MVLGVGRIDGDQRQVAPVLACLPCVAGLTRLGLGACTSAGKMCGMSVRVDGDHRDRLFAGQRAQHGQHLGARQADSAMRRAGSTSTRSPSLAPFRNSLSTTHFGLAALDRLDAERAVLQHAKDAENRRRVRFSKIFITRAGIGRALAGSSVGNVLASTRSPMPARAVAPPDAAWKSIGAGPCRGLIGLGRTRQQHAVAVAAEDVEHGDMGQGADAGQPLALLGQAPSSCRSRSMSFSQMRSSPLERERLGDVALAGASGFSAM